MKAIAARVEPICRVKEAWSKSLTENEQAWIECIRLASRDTDPAPTLELVQKVRILFSGRDRR